jgi:glycosyltransferase involved in cell wall biosynthesis
VETASIIISSRNHERFLSQAIESALAQTLAAEVVVVDDGSDDGSREVLARYHNRIVSVLQEWSGQGSAVNAGIRAASGSVLFFLDCDDLADPERVATLMPLFEQDRQLLWLRHSLRAVDDQNRVIVEELYHFGSGDGQLHADVLRQGKTPGTTSGLVFRRSFFDGLGLIPEHYTAYPDVYLLIRGALVGHGRSVQKTLGAHRWHRHAYTAYHWRQFHRASFHLFLRKSLAEDASALARLVGQPGPIAEGTTWWQMKAMTEWERSSFDGGGEWLDRFRKFLSAAISSDLPVATRLGIVMRGATLSVAPKRFFHMLWWLTHVGRPSILRPSRRH